MAYLEKSALVRLSSVTNSSTTVSQATLLPVTPLNYTHNTHMIQEGDRLAFTQVMTTRATGGYDGFFSHIVRSDEYSTLKVTGLPATYKAGFERPLPLGIAVDPVELSCSLISTDGADNVGIQTLNSNYYNENVVSNSILIEVS
jgi:hypothetical protein